MRAERPAVANIEQIAAGVAHVQNALPAETIEAVAGHTQTALEILSSVAVGSTLELREAHASLLTSTFALGGAAAGMHRTANALGAYTAEITDGVVPAGETSMATRQKQQRAVHPRVEFMNATGFLLYTAANERLLGIVRSMPIRPMPPDMCTHYLSWTQTVKKYYTADPAAGSLYLAARQLAYTVPAACSSFFRQAGVSRRELDQATPFTFNGGFNDMEFTWHFAPVIANHVATYLVKQGVLTQQQKNQLTLHDWADMIATPWFGRLMHKLAIAENGTYGSFGMSIYDYGEGTFARLMAEDRIIPSQSTPLFKHTGRGRAGRQFEVEPHPVFIRGLRTLLRSKDRSTGCPVARLNTAIPQAVAVKNPHFRRLVADGVLSIIPERSGNGIIRVAQPRTTISRTLTVVADQLRHYYSQYDQPVIVEQNTSQPSLPPIIIAHIKKPPARLFSPANTEERR